MLSFVAPLASLFRGALPLPRDRRPNPAASRWNFRRFRPIIEELETRRLLNGSPIVDHPGDQFSIEGESSWLTIGATDPESDPLNFGATGLPSGLNMDSWSGTISGVPDIGSAGSY